MGERPHEAFEVAGSTRLSHLTVGHERGVIPVAPGEHRLDGHDVGGGPVVVGSRDDRVQRQSAEDLGCVVVAFRHGTPGGGGACCGRRGADVVRRHGDGFRCPVGVDRGAVADDARPEVGDELLAPVDITCVEEVLERDPEVGLFGLEPSLPCHQLVGSGPHPSVGGKSPVPLVVAGPEPLGLATLSESIGGEATDGVEQAVAMAGTGVDDDHE